MDTCPWHLQINEHAGKRKWLSLSGFHFIVGILSISIVATASFFKYSFLGFCFSWPHQSFSKVNTNYCDCSKGLDKSDIVFELIVAKARSWGQSLISRFNWLLGPKDYISILSLKFMTSYSGQEHTAEQVCSAKWEVRLKSSQLLLVRPCALAQGCTCPEERGSFFTMENGPMWTRADLLSPSRLQLPCFWLLSCSQWPLW